MQTFLVTAVVLLGILAFHQRRKLIAAAWELRTREWERRTVIGFLNEIGGHFTSKLDLDESLDLVLDFTLKATRADAGGIFTFEGASREVLAPRVIKGLFPPLHEVTTEKLASRRKYLEEFVKKERIRTGEGIIGTVARTGQALLIPDARCDPRVPKAASDLVELEGLILAPLLIRKEVQGVIVALNKRDPDAPGTTFNEADLDLLKALADQAAITLHMIALYAEVQNMQRMEQELQVARDFQRLLLPRTTPNFPELEIAGLSEPALEVGGDYFDFIEVDERHLGVVIGDVSGKGIPGALVMATLRTTMRAEARGDLSPREVLRRVNATVTKDTSDGTFVSVTYGIVDRQQGTFTYARAGHEPLLCTGSNGSGPVSREPPGMVLGMVEGEFFDLIEEETVDLKSCGTAILYTDGVPEAMNSSREEYGQVRFEKVVGSRRAESPDGLIRAVLEDISGFTAGIPQHDDITLVVLRWRGQGER